MNHRPIQRLLFVFILLLSKQAPALVNYSTGSLEIDGMLLLQDARQPARYYYLPSVPRIATTPDGTPRLLMVKFIDPAGKTSGGLFHALVTLTLPPEALQALQEKLDQKVPGATVAGPVPLRESKEAGFQLVSSVLTGKAFTNTRITSGHAPLTPGSEAAISATLSQQGATLLWDSLLSPTSDVSVAISAWYEARIPAYRAEIHADISTVYSHFSRLLNEQEHYTRNQLRKIIDELVREGVVQIRILDRLPEDAGNKAMQQLADLAATKLIDLIFDMESGLTKLPEKEVAVEQGQIPGRQKYSKVSRLFLIGNNPEYVTDYQYVLKKRTDINRGSFDIRLERSTVVKVPFHVAGNLSGFFSQYREDKRLFRIVNLADPAFQRREVFLRIDGDYADLFEGRMNFVSVSLKKETPGYPPATGQVIFSREDIRKGDLTKSWKYARLGQAGEQWLDYQYRITWSLRGRKTIVEPPEEDQWITTSLPVLSLAPPLDRNDIVIDADRMSFEINGIRSALVEARYSLFGKRVRERLAILRNTDAESTNEVTLFSDPDTAIEYRVTWQRADNPRPVRTGWQPLTESYLALYPPVVENEATQ